MSAARLSRFPFRPDCLPRPRRPALISLLALTSLLLVIGPMTSRAFDEIGGDDVLVTTDTTLLYPSSMDIAENGDIYIAVAALPASGPEIRVFRSQDAGDTFPLWGTITLSVAPALAMDAPCLHVGEGDQNQVYVAFRFRGPSDANYSIMVASAPMSGGSGAWTLRLAMAAAGVDFQSPSLDSDEMSNAAYRLFLVAQASGADGADVWFNRSADFNVTWGSPYQIFSSTTGDGYYSPEVKYGRNGVIHCVCYWRPIATTGRDYKACYRRATAYGFFGIAGWGAVSDLSLSTDGFDEFHVTVAARHNSDDAAVAWSVRDLGGVFHNASYRLSTDGGLTWTGIPVYVPPGNQLPHLIANDDHGRFYAWGNSSGDDEFGMSTYYPDINSFSPLISPMDRLYTNVPNTPTGGRYFDPNKSKGGRPGFHWMTWNSTGADSVFFDGMWRADAGYPNIAPGFPRPLASGVVAPPAICELDGDPQAEIVFGSADGTIHVCNHDGTPVPGWPIHIPLGIFHADATIAVGDITGDSDNEVVAGNSTGQIFAFSANGTLIANWATTIVAGSPVYLAIGAISTAQRQVVTCCGNKVHLFTADGSIAPGFPVTTNTPLSCPPALGDVDGDGDREIVILQQSFLDVLTGNGRVQAARVFNTLGKTFSNAPTLADLDLDGDLEIVAPTDQGDVYVMNSDGSDYPGWPYHDPSGVRMTSVAIAEITYTEPPELFFCQEGPTAAAVHSFTATGVERAGYPRATVPGWYLYGMPIVDEVNQFNLDDVVVAARDQNAYALAGLDGSDLPGWPRFLGAQHNVSAASGDIDADGYLELVFTAWSPPQWAVVDVQTYVNRHPNLSRHWWPMYGYNPLRQGCLACDNDAVSGVDDAPPVAGRLTFAPPTPNPSAAPMTLRFELPVPAAARLDVFDVNGRLVRRLLKSELPAGVRAVTWDGDDDGGLPVAAGHYYLRLMVNGGVDLPPVTRSVVLLR